MRRIQWVFTLLIACADCAEPIGLPSSDALVSDASGEASPPGDADGPLWVADPGQPFPLYGGKCNVRDNGAKWLTNECISFVLTLTDTQLHLFLNYCVGTDGTTELCNGVRNRYTSLVIADVGPDTGHYFQAIGGRVLVNHPGAGRYERIALPGDPIPIDYEVSRQPHEAYPEGILVRYLKIWLPQVDAPGDPLLMEGTF
jgi:hypothetical protein